MSPAPGPHRDRLLFINDLLISLDYPDLSFLDERLVCLLTKKIDAKARLTEISVNELIGHWL